MVTPNTNNTAAVQHADDTHSSMDVDSTAPRVAAPDSDDEGDCNNDVLIGPDLNQHRSLKDEKVYRQFIMKNGLHVVIVSDTLAMGQRHEHGHFDEADSGYERESSSVEESVDGEEGADEYHEEGEDEHEDEHADGDEDDGIRKAAAAMVVHAGSFHDPLCCQGTAHYLEHMLFMGTKKYPSENAYDAFLQKNGGSDNAFTELEYTLFHFDVCQEQLFEALDMFGQFFVSPLLLPDAMDRELNAIESEFQLSKNADECRVQELMCHTGKDPKEHPFGKFSWGNTQSLKDIPEANGVDVIQMIRKFYNQYYYASNMNLVVIGAYSLDELQEKVVKCFSDVPPEARESSPLHITLKNKGTFQETKRSPIEDFGMPFPSSSLGRLYRIVPVKDRHSLTITWQLPPQTDWKAKPADYISHLLGHESGGSILSALKAKSWVNACSAGLGSGGHENASSHALFSFTLVLSEEGVSNWIEIVSSVYIYIGMVRYHCQSPDGLPPYIYDELKSVQEMAYRYHDEPSPDELVEDIAEATTCAYLPPERLLDGNSLLQQFNGEAIKDLLDKYFTPTNSRIDLLSSSFGQESDFHDTMENVSLSSMAATSATCCAGNNFSRETAGEPLREPNFGTRYWCHAISDAVLSSWENLREARPAPHKSLLGLPPLNPYIPTKFDLKPLPEDDPHSHPLVHCSLKICIQAGRKQNWYPATVVRHCRRSSSVLLSFEDEDEKWHRIDDDHSLDAIKPGFKGTFDSKDVKYKVIGVPREGEGAVMMYGDESDYHVEDGIHFPAIPPPSPEAQLPRLVSSTKGVKVYHLQDRKFKRPIAELRMQIACAGANQSPFVRACSDLFVKLVADALVETCYQATTCELGSSIFCSDVGYTIRVHGFDHKLLSLAQHILAVFFSFRRDSETLPDIIKEGRFDACLEILLRNYHNSGMQASRFCTDIRLRSIRPTIWSCSSKAKSLDGITVASFSRVVSSLLRQVNVDALYHGNISLSDAKEAETLIHRSITSPDSTILPRKKMSSQQVIKLPLTQENQIVIAPTKDANEPNTAVEVYFQVDTDCIKKRVLVDLLEHILYEPLFDALRTKEQFGYQVSCGIRWTFGVIGMSFRVVTACKSAREATDRIDQFLSEYREELVSMTGETYMENLVGLAKNKLQMFNSLSEETSHYWNEIVEGRYEWEVHRNEALCLRGITKDDLLQAYDEFLLPRCSDGIKRERRCITVHVIGTSDGACAGRPNIEADRIEEEVDRKISSVHKANSGAIWN